MHIHILRDTYSEKSTMGELYINDVAFSDTLEDEVRAGPKVPHKTAIPAGTYKVIIDYSTRFKRLMPHVLNVPEFEGIRFHWGNRPEDTDGCIVVGRRTTAPDWVGESRVTFEALLSKLMTASAHGEEITLIIAPKDAAA